MSEILTIVEASILWECQTGANAEWIANDLTESFETNIAIFKPYDSGRILVTYF